MTDKIMRICMCLGGVVVVEYYLSCKETPILRRMQFIYIFVCLFMNMETTAYF